MPIYEYTCTHCGIEKEVMHGINEQPSVECPNCTGEHLQRLISAAGFRLKGGGWYETDFKSSGQRNLAGDSKDSASGDGKTADSKPTGGDAAAKSDSVAAKPEKKTSPAADKGSAAA